jgi:enoyl-CoA hydratase/carnithine racemase
MAFPALALWLPGYYLGERMLIEVGQGRDNAVGAEHIQALRERFEEAVAAGRPVAFVPATEGKMFCAGFDLRDLLGRSHEEVRQAFSELLRLIRAVFHAPVPVAVIAGGHAVGVGAILLLAADRRLMAAQAKLRFPEASLGLGLFDDVVSLLHYRSGPALAERLLRYGQPIAAEEAVRLGLADGLSEQAPAAEQLLAELEASAPAPAFREMKRLCRGRFLQEPVEPQLDVFMRLWALPQTQQRMRELFPA